MEGKRGTGTAQTGNGSGRRILVVRLSAIGDALRVLPAVRRVRHEWPDATIGWALESWVHPVLAGNPNIDRFHLFDRREMRAGPLRGLRELRRGAREIRAAGYDTVLDFHGRFKSGLVSRLSGVATRIGYARGDVGEGNPMFNNVHVRLQDKWENRVLRFLHLLEPLGIDPVFDPADTGLFVLPEARDKARAWHLAAGAPVLAAFPGTSRLRTYGRWPLHKWVDLFRRLWRDGITAVLFWGPDDADYAREIADRAGECCLLAPPTTLPEMIAMLACFQGFIGANTAAMHMAWMQGVPTAWFPGPARPRTDGPVGVPCRALWAENEFRPGVRRQRQPNVAGAVPVDEAYAAVRFILGAAG
jgi:ADP-heptose:LPS heptosyltransferase